MLGAGQCNAMLPCPAPPPAVLRYGRHDCMSQTCVPACLRACWPAARSHFQCGAVACPAKARASRRWKKDRLVAPRAVVTLTLSLSSFYYRTAPINNANTAVVLHYGWCIRTVGALRHASGLLTTSEQQPASQTSLRATPQRIKWPASKHRIASHRIAQPNQKRLLLASNY